jgi:hypothetical protein
LYLADCGTTSAVEGFANSETDETLLVKISMDCKSSHWIRFFGVSGTVVPPFLLARHAEQCWESRVRFAVGIERNLEYMFG